MEWNIDINCVDKKENFCLTDEWIKMFKRRLVKYSRLTQLVHKQYVGVNAGGMLNNLAQNIPRAQILNMTFMPSTTYDGRLSGAQTEKTDLTQYTASPKF